MNGQYGAAPKLKEINIISIGGDIFKNKGNPLPTSNGRIWYEADMNYTSGFRGSDRLLYSNDGLIYKSIDHYKTFTKIK